MRRREPARISKVEQASDSKAAVLLAIKAPFADRIFAGTKRFELRKRLPKKPFGRVYLFVSAGGGIVGSFDVASRMTLPVEELWRQVGGGSTSRERFDLYFSGCDTGSAIEVVNPVRFTEPLLLKELRQRIKKFNAPQSFYYIPNGSALSNELEQAHRKARAQPSVRLRQIQPQEHAEFTELVTNEISPRYDEITPSFASNLLKINEQGVDPHGIFTTSKEVLAVERLDGTLLGFTTLTYKIGHSVKTGPSVLRAEHRGKGHGRAMRAAIDELVRTKGYKKIYCTVPDNEPHLLRHFIECQYRIEAHLTAQYQIHRGELVLGKVLEHSISIAKSDRRTKSATGESQPIKPSDARLAAEFFDIAYAQTWARPPADLAERLVRTAVRTASTSGVPYERKPLSMWVTRSSRSIEALTIMINKRGGATKALLLTSTAHAPTLRSLLSAIEWTLKSAGRRKIYFLHPISDAFVQQLLVSEGYVIEGTLREPYYAGQDAFVLSKFL